MAHRGLGRATYSEFQGLHLSGEQKFSQNFDTTEEEDKLAQLQHDPILSPLLEDLCQWLARTLQIDITPDTFTGPLQTGESLCNLAVLISKKAEDIGKKFPAIRFKANAKPFSFQARCNIEAFIKWAKALGVHDTCLFETVDIVEMKLLRNVLVCLLDVSRLADIYGVDPPELVKLEKSTKIGWQDLVALTMRRARENGHKKILSIAEVATHVMEIQKEVAEADKSGTDRASSIVNKWREASKKATQSRRGSDILSDFLALTQAAAASSKSSRLAEEEAAAQSAAQEEEDQGGEEEDILPADEEPEDGGATPSELRLDQEITDDHDEVPTRGEDGEKTEERFHFDVAMISEEPEESHLVDTPMPAAIPPQSFEEFVLMDALSHEKNEGVSEGSVSPGEANVDPLIEGVVNQTENIIATDQVIMTEVPDSPRGEPREIILIEDDLSSEEDNTDDAPDFNINVQEEHIITVHSQPNWEDFMSSITEDPEFNLGQNDVLAVEESGGLSDSAISDGNKPSIIVEEDAPDEFTLNVSEGRIGIVYGEFDDRVDPKKENEEETAPEVVPETQTDETRDDFTSPTHLATKSSDKILLLDNEPDSPIEVMNSGLNIQPDNMILVRTQADWDGVRLRGCREAEPITDESGPVVADVEEKPKAEGKRTKRKRSSDDGEDELPEKTSKGDSSGPAEVGNSAYVDPEGGYHNPSYDGSGTEEALVNPSTDLSAILLKEPSSPTRNISAVDGDRVRWSFVLCYPAVYDDEQETSLSSDQYQDLREKRCFILLLGIFLTIVGSVIALVIGILKADSGSTDDSSDSLSWAAFYILLAFALVCIITGISLISLWVVQHFKIKDGKIVECDAESLPSYGSIT